MVLSGSGPIRNAGGGEGEVLSDSGPIRKVGGGGWCCTLQARYKKRGCLAEEGKVPYMKGGLQPPNPPPPPPL